jgi:hypothetical protein
MTGIQTRHGIARTSHINRHYCAQTLPPFIGSNTLWFDLIPSSQQLKTYRRSLAFTTFGESKVERELAVKSRLSTQIYEHKKMNTAKTMHTSQAGILLSSQSGSERLNCTDLKNEH